MGFLKVIEYEAPHVCNIPSTGGWPPKYVDGTVWQCEVCKEVYELSKGSWYKMPRRKFDRMVKRGEFET